MEATERWDAAEELLKFIGEVITWTQALAQLGALGSNSVRAFEEFREVQLPKIEEDLRTAEASDFAPAGFTQAQTELKLAVAREWMAISIDPAAARSTTVSRVIVPLRKQGQDPELVQGGLEVLKEILGSAKGLSRWIEALSELVGVVVTDVKNRGLLKRFKNRGGRARRN